MSAGEHATITREQLARKLETTTPDNEDRRNGFALVNVLAPEAFARERIPESINIPAQDVDAFERRFEKGKELVLYCASPSCDASPKVARELVRRGYNRVVDYEGGVSDWREGGQPLEGPAG